MTDTTRDIANAAAGTEPPADDEGSTSPKTPEPAPPKASDTEAPAQPEAPPRPLSQSDIDAAVGKVRARFSDYDALKEQAAQIADGSHPALHALSEAVTTAERAKAETILKAFALEVAATRAGFIDPADAAGLEWPDGALTWTGDQPTIDRDAVAAAVTALAERKPYLINSTHPSPHDLGFGRSSANKPTSDDPLDMIAADVDAR